MANPRIDPVEQARKLGPSLAERAERIEETRTLPDDVVADLREADLFRLFVPKSLDGPEANVINGMEAIAEVARHEGSSAWCVMIAGTTSLLAGFLTDEHARVIYGPPDSCTGGLAAPVGTAREAAGGLRVTGTWAWGSGARHCTFVGGGVRLVDESGERQPRDDGLTAPFVFMDPTDVEFIDTWHVTGLAGSGSGDYTATEAFVPEGRWVQLAPTSPVLDGPLWQFPFYGMLAAGVASVSIGLLDGAIDRFVEVAGSKRPQGSTRLLAERPAAQAELSAAEATARSARTFLAATLGVAWDTAASGDPLSTEQRRSIRLAAADAAQRCADALVGLQRQAGGTAVYLREPLQRTVRDGQVAATHAMVADRIHELTGRLRLGLDTDTGLL